MGVVEEETQGYVNELEFLAVEKETGNDKVPILGIKDDRRF